MPRISEKELQQLQKDNPDIIIHETAVTHRGKTEAHKVWEAADRTKLEDKFYAWWTAIGGEPLEREYRFHPKRKYRADFCHLPTKIIVEIDGGLHMGGSHNSAAGYAYQQQRDREAYALGYTVYRLGTGFTLQQVEEVLDAITGAMNVQPTNAG